MRENQIDRVLDELENLANTAGALCLGRFKQKRALPDRGLLIGRGKVESIKAAVAENRVELIILQNELSGTQQRNLESIFQVKVIDRTRLILDIFAGRAASLEGKLQVELAQLLYLMPRLSGRGIELSRLGGGIGTRGPGETKLEADRRTIKKRIAVIRARLEKVKKDRQARHSGRHAGPVPVVSLVGYTCSGKSTLFSLLSGFATPVSARLFSTLDPLLRRVELDFPEKGYYFLLSDTVGFIGDLPRELFTSFQATLEEITRADLLLHVIDLANIDHRRQQFEVEKVLAMMKIPEEKIIRVYNKIDLPAAGAFPGENCDTGGVYISARCGIGIEALHKRIHAAYFSRFERFRLVLNSENLAVGLSGWTIVLTRQERQGNWHLEVLSERKKMLRFLREHGGLLE